MRYITSKLLQAAARTTQLASAKLLVITVTFLNDHAENVGDNKDQSGDRRVATAARNGVSSSQPIEFTRVLGDTLISRVTSENSPQSIHPSSLGIKAQTRHVY